MKKTLLWVVIILMIIVASLFFSRNIILKKVLEVKLTQINKGKVDIKKVDFNPFTKNITIYGIDVTSQKDTMKNFLSIEKFQADYDVYVKDKKVLVSKAIFSNIDFNTPRDEDGAIASIVRDSNDNKNSYVDNNDLETKKDTTLNNLEEILNARTRVNKQTINNYLQLQYEDYQNNLEIKKTKWQHRFAELAKTKDYMKVKNLYDVVAKEKNPLKLLQMEKQIKEAGNSLVFLSKQMLVNKEEMENDIKDILSKDDFETQLNNLVDEVVHRGEGIVLDLDDIVNYYLNEVYREQIDAFAKKYRGLMQEVELRRDEDFKNQDAWELFAEDIVLNADFYGIKLEGDIQNISSKLSENLDDINFTLIGKGKNSYGELKGLVNISKLEGEININISNVNIDDFRDIPNIKKYVISGEGKLHKNIFLTRNNIFLNGNMNFYNLQLNGKEINKKIDIKSPLLKDMIIPILGNIKKGEIDYKYNSTNGKIEIQSSLSKEIINILNAKDGYLKEKITQDLLNEGKAKIKAYEELMLKNNSEVIDQLSNELDDKMKYLDKVNEILEKFNISGSKDFKESLLNKVFKK